MHVYDPEEQVGSAVGLGPGKRVRPDGRLGSFVYSHPPRVSSACISGSPFFFSLCHPDSRESGPSGRLDSSLRHRPGAHRPQFLLVGSCLLSFCSVSMLSFSVRKGRARGSGRGPPALHQRRGLRDTVRPLVPGVFDRSILHSFMERYYGKGKWYILDTDAPPVIEVAAPPVCADSVRRARSPQGRSRMCRSTPVRSKNRLARFSAGHVRS